MNTLNQDIIIWAFITTTSAQTSKFKTKVKKIANKAHWFKGYMAHFPNKEKAEIFTESLLNLGVSFSVIYITDRQFGQIKINH